MLEEESLLNYNNAAVIEKLKISNYPCLKIASEISYKLTPICGQGKNLLFQ